MATLTTVPTQPAPARRPWNTLEILSRTRALLFALTAFLLAAIVFATQVHRGAMTLVGKDTTPSIIAAQQIKSAMADMDADAANALLNPNDVTTAKLFNQHHVEALRGMIKAARNTTYQTEELPLETLQVASGDYERLIQQAQDLQAAGHQDQAVSFYRTAGGVMDHTLLPAADALDKANDDVLQQEYESQSSRSQLGRVFVLLLGLAVIAALVLAQLFFSRRMQRTFNPALLAATLIALGLTFFAFAALAREQSDLREAKEDAFASIHALLQARATAYAANSDESRFLLDPTHAAADTQAFDGKSALLAHLPAQETQEQLLAQLRGGEKVAGFTGFLADEYNNITYPGEREAAIQSVVTFQKYLAIDKDIRRLEATPGQHQQAIALCTGRAQGQSNWAFDQFDDALSQTLAINEEQFHRFVDSGFSAVQNLELESCITGIVLAVLIFFGFAPRIREYQ